MVLLRIAGLALALASLLCPALLLAHQDEPLILDPDVSFDPGIDFGFDEDIFSGAFEQESDKSPTAKWFEDFTIRISQSTSGQANNHAIDLGPFGSFPRKPIWRPIGCSSMSATRTLSLPAGCCRKHVVSRILESGL